MRKASDDDLSRASAGMQKGHPRNGRNSLTAQAGRPGIARQRARLLTAALIKRVGLSKKIRPRRRDGAKEDAKNSIQKSSSRLPSLMSSNILFCWQDYVLTIPKEEILQG
jgi:hypothetical protein